MPVVKVSCQFHAGSPCTTTLLQLSRVNISTTYSWRRNACHSQSYIFLLRVRLLLEMDILSHLEIVCIQIYCTVSRVGTMAIFV